MSSEAVEEKVSQFPMTLRETGKQLVACQLDAKRIEKRIKGLKKFLADNMDRPEVPVGVKTLGSVSVEKQGVTRSAWNTPSTQWVDNEKMGTEGTFDILKREVLNAKQCALADHIKERCTVYGYREKFTVEEEE